MKTKIIRVNNTRGVRLLRDKLLQNQDMNPDTIINELEHSMETRPDHVLLLQAWQWEDKKENNKGDSQEEIVGFLIALAPAGMSHTFVLQAWIDNKKAPEFVGKKFFARLLFWSEELGRDEIRMETRRDPEAFHRKWGFTAFSTVMHFVIPQDLSLDGVKNADDPRGEVLDEREE